LARLGILDSAPDVAYDQIIHLVAELIDVPIAFVGLLDRDRQWFKAKVGLDIPETPRDVSFCQFALAHEGDGALVINDAQRDPRFAANPLVTGEPGIRFYAGQPLHAPGGERVGALCVIDRVPRELDDRGRDLLRGFSVVIERLFAHHQVAAAPVEAQPRLASANREHSVAGTTSEIDLLPRLEVFAKSLGDALAVIERERAFIGRIVADLADGRSFRSIVEQIGAEGKTQQRSLTAAISQLEDTRRMARIEMFRVLTQHGYSVADIARLWGVSRQLVSRTMNG
jgi:GAF domain-containing protein